MKRRHFIGLNATAIAASGLSTVGLQSAALTDARAVDLKAGSPVLQNPDIGEISVVWRVHQLSTGQVEYGLTKKLGKVAVADEHGMRLRDDKALMVRLTDLKPDTTYYYRVVTTPIKYAYPPNVPVLGTTKPGAIYKFRTPAVKSDRASFAVINDTHEHGRLIHGLFKKLQADPEDVVIWNGDMFNNVTSTGKIMEQTLDLLGPQAYAAETPIVYTYGNHDVRGEYAPVLENVIPTRQGRRYFTFQNGPIQFMVLDTGEDKPDSHPGLKGMTEFEDYRSEQRDWIAGQIRRPEWRGALFRVILCHIPPSYSPDARKKWEDLLSKGGADLMICGHVHHHGYVPPKAARLYPVLIGGGPGLAAATIIRGRAKGRALEMSIELFNGKPVFRGQRPGKWTIKSRS